MKIKLLNYLRRHSEKCLSYTLHVFTLRIALLLNSVVLRGPFAVGGNVLRSPITFFRKAPEHIHIICQSGFKGAYKFRENI